MSHKHDESMSQRAAANAMLMIHGAARSGADVQGCRDPAGCRSWRHSACESTKDSAKASCCAWVRLSCCVIISLALNPPLSPSTHQTSQSFVYRVFIADKASLHLLSSSLSRRISSLKRRRYSSCTKIEHTFSPSWPTRTLFSPSS